MFNDGFVLDGKKRFWDGVGEWSKAGSKTSCKNNPCVYHRMCVWGDGFKVLWKIDKDFGMEKWGFAREIFINNILFELIGRPEGRGSPDPYWFVLHYVGTPVSCPFFSHSFLALFYGRSRIDIIFLPFTFTILLNYGTVFSY